MSYLVIMDHGHLAGIEWGTVYRSTSPVHSVAFARKPTNRGWYTDRRLDAYALVYVLRGTGVMTDWHGRQHALVAGCAVQMPAGLIHSVVHNPDGQWAEAWLTLDGRFGKALAELGSIDITKPVLFPDVDASLIEQFARLRADLRDLPDRDLPQTLAAAHQLLVAICAADARRGSVDPQEKLIEHACSLLCRNWRERIDLESIAGELDLSYERFRKIFRQRQGVSPGEYRIRRRIDQARALITQHRLSNKEIAAALGYADPFTFSKQFKQVVGLSPAQFRQRV
ncbi:MAG TPA: AraC family transcriptional regulator [Pirellulales bacterium]|nr:AraC family transcriptional regulator [Pirellulales bacterium]